MFKAENFFLFAGLTGEQKAEILNELPQQACFNKGEVIFDEKTYRKAIGIILSGRAAAFCGRVTQRTFAEGDVFGAAAVFGESGCYVSKIVAKTETRVLFVDESVLRELFVKYPQTAVNYITFLSDRVRFLNKKISQLGSKTARDKLYAFLSANADSGEYSLTNMKQLANLTGIGRTSLYRALSELEDEGKIEKTENKVKVI